MNSACKLCKGACCEYMILNRFSTPEINEWLGARCTVTTGYGFEFDCVCPHLKEGKCDIYNSRPKACKEFSVGSAACFRAITRQRPSEDTRKIMAELVRNGNVKSG